MYDFKITKTDFMINGKKELLLCGELHYFRMEKQYWEKALDALVDCGCNAVAYYVPWFVHEYEEGKFDFTGELCPENDLHTWIQLTQKRACWASSVPALMCMRKPLIWDCLNGFHRNTGTLTSKDIRMANMWMWE